MNRLAPVLAILIAIVLGWLVFGGRPKDSIAGLNGGRSPEVADDPVAARLESIASENAVRALADPESIDPELGTTTGPAAATESDATGTSSTAGPRLEVLVTYDDSPLAGSEVRVVPFEEFSEFLVDGATPEPIGRAATDASGVARFGLSNADALGIAAAGPGGAIARARVAPPAGPARVRVVLALGSASLEGTVRDLDGKLAAGVRVIAGVRKSGEEAVWLVTRTDASGSYRLAGLAGGDGRVVRAEVLDLPLGESRPFALARGAVVRRDFGSASGRATWSGVLRSPSGIEIPGSERLAFVASSGETVVEGYVDEHARFFARLPAGTYAAHLRSAAGTVLGTADVSGELVQDLVAPRVYLHGRIRYVGSKHPVARGPENDVELVLERADGARHPGGLLRGPSSFAGFALEPGTYVLATKPWPLDGAADGRMRIEIPADRSEVEVDVAITDP